MEESGLEWTPCNPMRRLSGPPARKPWRPLKPSEVTLRGSMTNIGEGHESAARAEVNLGPGLETDLGPIQETSLGPILGASLEAK